MIVEFHNSGICQQLKDSKTMNSNNCMQEWVIQRCSHCAKPLRWKKTQTLSLSRAKTSSSGPMLGMNWKLLEHCLHSREFTWPRTVRPSEKINPASKRIPSTGIKHEADNMDQKSLSGRKGIYYHQIWHRSCLATVTGATKEYLEHRNT